jgi:hypothetical protein
MEHRYTVRIKTSLNVVIYDRRGNDLEGALQNVSREGMYIRTDSRHVRKGETLDIGLAHDCYMRVYVVHVNDEGFGVLIVPPSDDVTIGASPPYPLPDLSRKCLETGVASNQSYG